MPYQFTLSMLPLFIAALISLALAWYTWKNRQRTAATTFSVMMFVLFEWGISYILHLAATDLQTKLLWDQIMFLGVVATPVAWFAFAMEYIGRKTWINAQRLIILSIIPVITTVIIWTNSLHKFFWADYRLVQEGPFLLMGVTNVGWFWVHAAYSYILILIGLVLVIRALLRWPAQYRAQMIVVIIATLTPLIANAITIFKLLPIYIDLTPFAFIVTGMGMAFALFRHRLLDLAPIARDLVIHGMKEGMIIIDANRLIVDINPAAQQIIGLSGEHEPIGKSILEVLAPWPHLIERYRNIEDGEDEIVFGEGEDQRWYELRLSTLRDESQLMIGQVISIRNITRRKRAENQLQESEVRFRQIVENASDLIYRTDATGHFVYANPAVLHILGFEQKDALGKHYLDLVAPQARHKLKRLYEHQFVSRTKNTYCEFPVLAKDGSELWFGQNVQLIYAGEKVIGFQCLARDVTAIKRAQEALRIARDQALEASRAKSQLLSKVSHELRTPLGGILGYAELLRDDIFGKLNEDQKRVTNEIMESASYLTTMVNELLDEAQMQSNTLVLHERNFSPATLLQTSISGMEIVAQKKGLQFKSSLDENLPDELYGDDHRLRQIIRPLA